MSWITNDALADRGQFSCEVILHLFALKLRHPNKVFMIRGNHECSSVSRTLRFLPVRSTSIQFTEGNEEGDGMEDAKVLTAGGGGGHPAGSCAPTFWFLELESSRGSFGFECM